MYLSHRDNICRGIDHVYIDTAKSFTTRGHHIISEKLYVHLDTIWTHFFIPCTLKENTHTVK